MASVAECDKEFVASVLFLSGLRVQASGVAGINPGAKAVGDCFGMGVGGISPASILVDGGGDAVGGGCLEGIEQLVVCVALGPL